MERLVWFFANCGQSFYSLIKIFFLSKKFSKLKETQKTHDQILILGNGPSMKEKLDDPNLFDKLKSLDLLCVNHFCESDYYSDLKPKLYIHAAPEMYQDNVNDEIENKRQIFWDTLVEKTDWELDFFIPYLAKKNDFWLKKVSANPKIKVHYYNIIALEGFEGLVHWMYNRGLGMPRVHNIIGYSIMNMIRLNYKTIYLTGVEHSWLNELSVTKDNVALVGQPHLYDPNRKPDVMYKNGVSARKLHEILHKFYVTFKGYWAIKKYADKKSVKIYNLTQDSFIDAFDRKDLSEIL